MFKKNLKRYRLKKSLTRRELARLCSLSPAVITDYERGKKFPENMKIVKDLAQALDVRVSDFLTNWDVKLRFIDGQFKLYEHTRVILSKKELRKRIIKHKY